MSIAAWIAAWMLIATCCSSDDRISPAISLEFVTPPRRRSGVPSPLHQSEHRMLLQKSPQAAHAPEIRTDTKATPGNLSTPTSIKSAKHKRVQQDWVAECLNIDIDDEELVEKYRVGFMQIIAVN